MKYAQKYAKYVAHVQKYAAHVQKYANQSMHSNRKWCKQVISSDTLLNSIALHYKNQRSNT